MRFLIPLLAILLCTQCFVIENQYTRLAPGTWRATLQLVPQPTFENKKGAPLPELMDHQFEEVASDFLPFTFEVIYENENDFYIEIINGEERYRVDDITYGLDRSTAKDTITIKFKEYESELKAIVEGKMMAGEWIVHNRKNYSIPFKAEFGKGHRFTELRKTPKMDLTGKWEIHFLDEKDPYDAIGEFQQNGNKLTGTFITETGDFRYLEGTVQNNKMYLSCFDGAHAFVFEAKIKEDQTLVGSFRSGKHYKVLWEGKKNENFTLKNPLELTYLKEGYNKVDFNLKGQKGNVVSLSDDRFKNKIKIVQIMGTWCPNCRDETLFLTDYLKKNSHEDLEIISLAFEKHKDANKAYTAINNYKKKMNIPYDMLWAGSSNKKEAAKTLPMLNEIISYPTMIFIDRNDKVRKIHTGFSGPATSEYIAFKEDFNQFVDELLNENKILN